jgi:hypothetical protein
MVRAQETTTPKVTKKAPVAPKFKKAKVLQAAAEVVSLATPITSKAKIQIPTRPAVMPKKPLTAYFCYMIEQ